MSLPELFRTSVFRLSAYFSLAFALSTGLLFAFIYWETAVYENERIEKLLTQEADVVSHESEANMRLMVETRLAGDFHRMTYAALLDSDGARVAGNLRQLPAGFPVDGVVHRADIDRTEDGVTSPENVLLLARALPDGRLLVVGRSIDELDNLASVVRRALELGGVPALTLALLTGVFLSVRALRQVKAVNQTAERIMEGNFRERLPIGGTDDEFDRLAASVNKMLDEIESLVDQVKGVSDNIAHDLRTPLTRMHTRLERARSAARSREELEDCIDRAISDLDTTLRIVTALLRIGEIEDGRRRAGFAAVDLGGVARGVAELYEPIAEEKQINFVLTIGSVSPVQGDRELLIEAVANLVENAIKFTLPGGRVELGAINEGGVPIVRVADSGPGISPDERGAIFRRFYRSEPSRNIQGSGLGLSLVEAIARLHGFRITVDDASPGSIFTLVCSTGGK